METRRTTARRGAAFVCFGLVAAAIAALYHFFGSEGELSQEPSSIFRWLFIQWHDRDMQLTWVMPLVGLYAVWDRRRELAETPARASLLGVAATAASLALHVLAFRAQQPRVSLFTVATTLWSSCWAIWGWGVARQLLFPLGYTILSFLCFHIKHYTTVLQVFASNLSVIFLRGFGVDATNIGSVIRVSFGPETQPLVFNVAEGCSGLRSLVVLSALAAPYAYFRVRGNLRAWILFAMSVPLAILTNILRISTLTLFAFCFGTELAMQLYHDPAGFLVFFIGILLLQATATFLGRDWNAPMQRIREAFRRRFGGRSANEAEPETPSPEPPPSPASQPSPETPESTPSPESPEPPPAALWRLPVATALLVLFIGLSARHLSQPRVFRGAPNCPIDVPLPAELGPYRGEEVLFCTNDQCCRDYPRSEFPEDGEGLTCPVCSSPLDTISIGERNGLPPGTPILRRIYTLGKNSQPVQVSIVYSGLERNSIHRPQRCLASQGYQIIAEQNLDIPLEEDSSFPVHVLDIIRRYKNDAGRTVSQGGIYAYWYFNPERSTPSHFDRVIRIALDNILRDYRPRWAYVAIALSCDPEHREPAYEVLRDIVPRLLPVMRESQASLKSHEQQ